MKKAMFYLVLVTVCVALGGCVSAKWTQDAAGKPVVTYNRFLAGADSLTVAIDGQKATVNVNKQNTGAESFDKLIGLAEKIVTLAATAATK